MVTSDQIIARRMNALKAAAKRPVTVRSVTSGMIYLNAILAIRFVDTLQHQPNNMLFADTAALRSSPVPCRRSRRETLQACPGNLA